ncbi:MAG: hypothetical protein KIPDCIKN_00852 [Haliscomenobacter sp.]|jgi:hypothetical protein|nr:hypothetical protein [Haliscomenobacter sp.]
MKYLEWNNVIGSLLFNESMAGKEVYLFLTHQELIEAGKATGNYDSQPEASIWDDFIRAIRNGIPGEPAKGNYLDKVQAAYVKKTTLRIDGIEILYPPYLCYLVLTVLPVLESQGQQINDTLRTNNYYARINNFFERYNIPTLPNQNQNHNWNHIWQHLSDWSTKTKKTDLGIFTVRNFSNAWIYAGIPLSQCLIDPKALKRLPAVFLKEGLVPNGFIHDNEWRALLEKTWVNDLHQRQPVIVHIRAEGDEMGKVVIEIVKQAYNNWKGGTELEEEQKPHQPFTRIKKEGIRSRLFLAFKLDRSRGEFRWGCRMYSKNDYPEDLSFNGLPCFESREYWSNQLELGFLEKTVLKDVANKWEAVLPEKDLRLFIGGANLNLAADYWIETDEFSSISPMRLLCRNSRRQDVEEWGKHFVVPGKFRELTKDDFDGIPDTWILFEFQYPQKAIDGIQITSSSGAKRIILTGGVKLGTRTYLHGCLPEIEIENTDGFEEVFLELVPGGNKVALQKKTLGDGRWMLPPTLNPSDEFIVSAGTEKTPPQRIAAETLESLKLDNAICPKRNRFGVVDDNENTCYVQGSLIQGFDFTRQKIYEHRFTPNSNYSSFTRNSADNYNTANGLLLEFLTRRKTCHPGEFFEAFEQVLYRKITGELEDENVNLAILKRQVLNWYDFLGYVDFDYQSKRIVTNPPQMFLIPTPSGRRALLTGARTPDFVEKVFESAKNLGLQMEVTPQAGARKSWLLLPDTLYVKAMDMQDYGTWALRTFADSLGIYFDPAHIVQWGLLHFSASIDDYENQLNPDERFEDWDWSRKVFNPDTFRFERHENEHFDRSYTLVEYQLNAYTYYHILWRNGIAYHVDKSWGRWMVLKHLKKQVIFRDNNDMTAIPTGTPLPRLISESLMLCSGRIPTTKDLELDSIRTNFFLFGNVVKIMLDNEFCRIGQNPIEINQTF